MTEWKMSHSVSNFTRWAPGHQLKINVGLGTGVALNRQRSIIWPNHGLVHYSICPPQGLGELLILRGRGIYIASQQIKQNITNSTKLTKVKCKCHMKHIVGEYIAILAILFVLYKSWCCDKNAVTNIIINDYFNVGNDTFVMRQPMQRHVRFNR